MATNNGNRTTARSRSDSRPSASSSPAPSSTCATSSARRRTSRGKLKSKLPIVAGAAASAGFVLAGGVGATMRYFARRGREGHEKVRVGRWSIFDRD